MDVSKEDSWLTDSNNDMRDVIADDDDALINNLIDKDDCEEMEAMAEFEEDCMMEFFLLH